MSEINDEKETDIDAEIEKAEVKMVSFGELVSSWYDVLNKNSQNFQHGASSEWPLFIPPMRDFCQITKSYSFSTDFEKFLVLNILRYNCIDTQYFMTLEFKISSIVHICRCLYLHFNKMYIVTWIVSNFRDKVWPPDNKIEWVYNSFKKLFWIFVYHFWYLYTLFYDIVYSSVLFDLEWPILTSPVS